MYKVYQSCGHLSISSEQKSAVIETMLPTAILKELYEYVKFYNISKKSFRKTEYGILGVLVIKGDNPNLNRDYSDDNEATMLNILKNGLLNLKSDIDNSFSKVSLNNIKERDRLSFVCFHDTKFEKNKDIVLKHYQDHLSNIFRAPKLELPDKEEFQPKVGNGGILTAEGCIDERP